MQSTKQHAIMLKARNQINNIDRTKACTTWNETQVVQANDIQPSASVGSWSYRHWGKPPSTCTMFLKPACSTAILCLTIRQIANSWSHMQIACSMATVQSKPHVAINPHPLPHRAHSMPSKTVTPFQRLCQGHF